MSSISHLPSTGNKNYCTIPNPLIRCLVARYLDIPDLLNYRLTSKHDNFTFRMIIQQPWYYAAEIGSDLKPKWEDVTIPHVSKKTISDSTTSSASVSVREQPVECDREAFAIFKHRVLCNQEFTRIFPKGDLGGAFSTLWNQATGDRRPSNLLHAVLPSPSSPEETVGLERWEKIQAAIISDLFEQEIPATSQKSTSSSSSSLGSVINCKPISVGALQIITMHSSCKNIDVLALDNLAQRLRNLRPTQDLSELEMRGRGIDAALKLITMHETNQKSASQMGGVLGHMLILAIQRKDLKAVQKLLCHTCARNIPFDDQIEKNGFLQALGAAIEKQTPGDSSEKILQEILSFLNEHAQESLSEENFKSLLSYAIKRGNSDLIRVLGSCRGAENISADTLALAMWEEPFLKDAVSKVHSAIIQEILRFPNATLIRGLDYSPLLGNAFANIDCALEKRKIDQNDAFELMQLLLNFALERNIYIGVVSSGGRYHFGAALNYAVSVGNLAFVEQVCAHFSARVPVEGEHGLIKALQEALSSTQENRIAIARKLVQFPQFPKERAEELISDEALRKQLFSSEENR